MKNGKIDIVDKCVSCGKLTDNDTGKIAKKEDISKDAYINYWVCKKCGGQREKFNDTR